MDLTSITPDVTGLKALAHPVRLRILGLLRSEGPATATTLAQRLGLNSGATSYHLRQLALHGFIVDDPERGDARDRWWRAAHRSTVTHEEELAGPEEQQTLGAYLQAVAVVHTEALQRGLEERDLLPAPWREASQVSDWAIRLTPAGARRLGDALVDLISGWPEEDDVEAADFVVQVHAFPRPGVVASP